MLKIIGYIFYYPGVVMTAAGIALMMLADKLGVDVDF